MSIDDRGVSLLTNAHVVGTTPGRVVKVWFYQAGHESKPTSGKVAAVDYDPRGHRDLAVVRVSLDRMGDWRPPVLRAAWDWQSSGAIRSRGCPGCRWPSEVSGNVTSDLGEVFDFKPVALAGRSGSPVVVDRPDGPRLVGVVTWRTGEGRGRAQSLAAIASAVRGEKSNLVRASTVVPVADQIAALPTEPIRFGFDDVGCGPFSCDRDGSSSGGGIFDGLRGESTTNNGVVDRLGSSMVREVISEFRWFVYVVLGLLFVKWLFRYVVELRDYWVVDRFDEHSDRGSAESKSRSRTSRSKRTPSGRTK